MPTDQTERETYADHWEVAAKKRTREGVIDRHVATTLFDHSWVAALDRMDRELQFEPGDTVLDAGCGWGRLLLGVKHFHPRVAVEGYELTAEFVEKARDIAADFGVADGVKLVQADLLEVDLPSEYYDAIYSSRVLHYIQDKALVTEKFYEALKPGGKAMVMIPNRTNPYQRLTYKHAPLFPIREMGRIMEAAGFNSLRYGGYRFLPAGQFSSDGFAARAEKALASTPLGRLGGIAYVVGQK